jgi:hypothetical protein
VPLEPRYRDKAIGELAGRQFPGADSVPRLKRQLRDEMTRRAEQAWDVGGIELYLWLKSVGPVPLAASLLVSGRR